MTLLDSEWRRLNHASRILHIVNSWNLRCEPFGSLDEVLIAAGYRGAKCDPVADQILAALVRRAATDQLAARIVLQRVVPPLMSIANRRGRTRGIGFDDALGTALSHAWEVICTYPIERRPIKIAVNIVRDIEYFAFVRSERRRPVHGHLNPELNGPLNMRSADLMSHEDPYGSSFGNSPSEVEFSHLMEMAHQHGVSQKSLNLLNALAHQSIDDFAAAHGVTRRTVRDWMKEAANELRVRTQCAA